ncbi:MAG TPA: CAP domain-containing protein [Ktedonobacteraceae bacterium]|nr:CAP domain-containing protein [Ktedonobacteraceae bacterium]
MPQIPLTSQDQQAIVDTHNKYRSEPQINTPTVAWDDTLVAGAQDWANQLAQTGQWDHSPDAKTGTVGENIAKGTGSPTATQLADGWKTQEQPNFKPGIFPDISKTGDWHAAGHYSQMIWRSTTRVGCGFATDGTTTYLVCRYMVPGNKEGIGVPSPQPVTLAQISALGANNVFGVDAAKNVYWYNSDDGTTWTRISITGKQMQLVSVASDLTLCGLDTSGAIWKCDLTSSPQTWTPMTPAGPTTFKHVSYGSATSIWAIGTDSTFYQYDGTSWKQITSGMGSGTMVSVASDGTTVWEIAYTKGLYYYTPAGWAQPSVPSGLGGGATHVSCGSATNIWIVGADGKYYQYNGSTWTTPPVGSGGAKQVSVAASDQTVWAIGKDNQVSRLVNSAWSPLLM